MLYKIAKSSDALLAPGGQKIRTAHNFWVSGCRCRDIYAEVRADDQCVLIPDMFPKARHHALIIARDMSLSGPDQLRAEHIPLLQHMQVRFGWEALTRSSLWCVYWP